MATAFHPNLVKYPVDVDAVKDVLHFMEREKPASINSIIKPLQQVTHTVQRIRDLRPYIDVLNIEDANDVNSTLKYLHSRSDEDILAYVRLYVKDKRKNTVWMKCDFPCPVVFDFYKTKTENMQVNQKVIEKGCNKEFTQGTRALRRQLSVILDDYSSNLQTVISIYENVAGDSGFIREAFDENIQRVWNIARHVQLRGVPGGPYKVRNHFKVKTFKTQIVKDTLRELGGEIKDSIRQKLKNKIHERLNTDVFDAVEIEVLSHPDWDWVTNIFVMIVDAVVMLVEVVTTVFVPKDINSDEWRNGVASEIIQSLEKHSLEIVTKIQKEARWISHDILRALTEELHDTQKHRLPIYGNGKFGVKVRAACYGTDDYDREIIGLRAENIEHIHLYSEKDILVDMKTTAESSTEMRSVKSYLNENNHTPIVPTRSDLKQLIRNYTPELMKKHSNLITISTSPVMSRQNGIVEIPCIVFYCFCKGIIPLGEHKFPRKLENIPTDVRENFIYFGKEGNFYDPLRIGCSIGISENSKAGSLAVFVNEIGRENCGFLTCAHVLLSDQELTNDSMRQNIRNSTVTVDVVQPSFKDDQNNLKCGRLIDARFGNVIYQNEFTGVDCAYVEMTSRIPHELKFHLLEWECIEAAMNDGYTDTGKMGLPILEIGDDDKEHCVYKVGRTTGYTRGVLKLQWASLRKVILSGSLSEENTEEVVLHNMYMVESFRKPFFRPGDSGAAVFIRKDGEIRVIGLAVAGFETSEECFVTPIGAVLDSIEPKVEIRCFSV